MLRAVLMNERLKEFGKYDYSEVNTIYQALDSDNYVINAVAQIIKRTEEGASEREQQQVPQKITAALCCSKGENVR